jgi:hypothetical protein
MQIPTASLGLNGARNRQGQAAMSDEKTLLALKDRIEVQDVICAMTGNVDAGDYAKVRRLFTPDAVMKYGTLFGDQYASRPASEFLDFVETYMPGFDHTQHQITNFEIAIDGDVAVSRSQVRSSHWIGERDWLVVSTYHHTLVRRDGGWKIQSAGADKLFESGADLVALAAERVKSRQVKA